MSSICPSSVLIAYMALLILIYQYTRTISIHVRSVCGGGQYILCRDVRIIRRNMYHVGRYSLRFTVRHMPRLGRDFYIDPGSTAPQLLINDRQIQNTECWMRIRPRPVIGSESVDENPIVGYAASWFGIPVGTNTSRPPDSDPSTSNLNISHRRELRLGRSDLFLIPPCWFASLAGGGPSMFDWIMDLLVADRMQHWPLPLDTKKIIVSNTKWPMKKNLSPYSLLSRERLSGRFTARGNFWI